MDIRRILKDITECLPCGLGNLPFSIRDYAEGDQLNAEHHTRPFLDVIIVACYALFVLAIMPVFVLVAWVRERQLKHIEYSEPLLFAEDL